MKVQSCKSQLLLLILSLSLLCMSPSWAGGGPLHGDASNYFEQTLAPLLINEKLCNSFQDCTYKHHYYSFAISLSQSIDFDLYGITDERIIKEIVISMLNSGLKIEDITFWKSEFDQQSFLEKPIAKFIDHAGGK